VNAPYSPLYLRQLNTRQLIDTLIDHADQLEFTRRYELVDRHPIHAVDGSALFPALAIPVESKLEFECPEEHLVALRTAIPEVDKLLVIGWRAAETPFLELLATNLRQEVEALVVAGNSDAATETAHRLKRAGVKGDYVVTEGGFTELVVDRQADEFLSS
jgi:hypothetical protein